MQKTRTFSKWCGGAWLLGVASLFLGACASAPTVPVIPTGQKAVISPDGDFTHLLAQVRADDTESTTREAARRQIATAAAAADADLARRQHQREFADRARTLFSQLTGSSMTMPVLGVYASSLDDDWLAPRDGGVRQHKGIDIFARKGTPVVAVTNGIISFIGDEPKGGHCVWLTASEGLSFYYAHLDRWAPGLYEGLEVQRGDILGYVGNTGNAIHTPSHLHFGINRDDEMVNPYPVLIRAATLTQAHLHTASADVAPAVSTASSSSAGSR